MQALPAMSNALEKDNDARRRLDDAASQGASAASMPDRIAQFIGSRPLFVLPRAWGTRLSAARWKLNGQTTLRSCALDELVLGCRASGTATVIRRVAEGSLRKRPVLGAVSLLNPAQN